MVLTWAVFLPLVPSPTDYLPDTDGVLFIGVMATDGVCGLLISNMATSPTPDAFVILGFLPGPARPVPILFLGLPGLRFS